MTLRRRRHFFVGLLPLVAAVAACSSSTSGSGAPAQGTYTIVFPSIDLPVYADEIQVLVFPSGDAATQCLDLINAQEHSGTLPSTVPGIPTQPIPPCKLNSGAGALSLAFGSYAVLAVVQKGGQDVAVGCQQQTLSAASPTMTISVEILNVSIPSTPCTSLSAYCSNTCG